MTRDTGVNVPGPEAVAMAMIFTVFGREAKPQATLKAVRGQKACPEATIPTGPRCRG